MNIKQILLFSFFVAAMGLMLGACSESEFSSAPGSVFQQCVDARPEVKCLVTCDDSGQCFKSYDYTIKVDGQFNDILFVVDNSGSMYKEQQKMGSMFPNFMNMIRDLDYRVAITTTDIQTSENPADIVNNFGAYQDGNLVKFPDGQVDGSFFLDGTLPLLTEQDYFEQTIAWEQTNTCERNRYVEEHCPSGDERGILAAAMTIEKNPGSFIRPVGHLAVVILSDEDEGTDGSNMIDEREDPQTFIDTTREKYPNKTVSFHSIIIQPGDRSCLDQQDEPSHPKGYYGDVYSLLTELTNGIPGDICASDSNYASQLNEIGADVARVREPMPCRPINDELQVDFIPDPGYPVELIKNFSQNEILFSEPLPANTEIRFRFKCNEK